MLGAKFATIVDYTRLNGQGTYTNTCTPQRKDV